MLTDSFPGVGGVVDTTELRKNLAGLITRNADGTARAGVFYRGTAPIGTPRTGDMKVDLNVFHAGLVRTGVLFIANDGVAQSPALPIPSSNSIYHVIYAKQVETDPPYSDSGTAGPIFGIASSDQGATPDVNQAISRIPAGGLPLVSVLVPATATTTSSAGVVLRDIAPFTAAAGAPVAFRTLADLLLWTNPTHRQNAFVFADPTAANNGTYFYDGPNSRWIGHGGSVLIYSEAATGATPSIAPGGTQTARSVSITLPVARLCRILMAGYLQTGASGANSAGTLKPPTIDGSPAVTGQADRRWQTLNAAGNSPLYIRQEAMAVIPAGTHTIAFPATSDSGSASTMFFNGCQVEIWGA